MTTGKTDQDQGKPIGKHFTKALLIAANEAAEKKRLNRQLKKRWVRSLPKDVILPIEFTMPHYFAGGRPAETHMRCFFVSPEGLPATVDCPMDIYHSLPGDNDATPTLPGTS
jgi:hypothetical protein